MRWNCMSKPLRFIQITAKHQDFLFFTVFLTIKTSPQNNSITLSQILLKLDEHQGRYWRKKLPWTILEEQVKLVIASFRCYDNSDVAATLIITNFNLYLIHLWWQFFKIFVYGDVVYAETWEVLTLKNCIEPPQVNGIHSLRFWTTK